MGVNRGVSRSIASCILAMAFAHAIGCSRAGFEAAPQSTDEVFCWGESLQECDDGDPCTDDICDGGTCKHTDRGGACADGALCPPGGTEGPSGDANCRDGLDNDCDSFFDAADSDCVPNPLPRMYWADAGPPARIQSAFIDGTGVRDLGISSLTSPNGVFVDAGSGKIYFADSGARNVRRANLDGSAVEEVVESFCAGTPWGVTLDIPNNRVFYGDPSESRIEQVDVPSSWCTYYIGVGGAQPRWPHLNPTNGTLYWSDEGDGTIYGIELASSWWFERVSGINTPAGVAVDPASDLLYFAEAGTGRLRRASAAGTNANVQDVLTGLGRPTGIALDLVHRKIYWTDPQAQKIQRANLDGSGVEDLITTGLSNPQGIAVE